MFKYINLIAAISLTFCTYASNNDVSKIFNSSSPTPICSLKEQNQKSSFNNDFLCFCTLCPISTKKTRNGKQKHFFCSKESYNTHFDRYHRKKFESKLLSLPYGAGERLKFKLQFLQKIPDLANLPAHDQN